MKWSKVLLFAVSLHACNGKGSPPPEVAEHPSDGVKLDPDNPALGFVKIETVTEIAAAPLLTLTGRVTFDEDHTQRVSSPIDGRATNLLAQLGASVKLGQPVVELSSPHVGQLQSDAQRAVSDLALAQKSVDRAHKLQGDGAISEKDVAQVESDWRKAKSEVARTSAQLRSLSISATDPTVNVALRAQVAGTVVERNVLVGQEIRADAPSPLLTITDLETVWVLADVYEQDLRLVQLGGDVLVRVPAYRGEDFAGKVGYVGDVVDATSHTVKIRCIVPNPGGRLKPEMFATVQAKDAPGAKAIVIPARAVLNDTRQPRVLVASEGNLFRSRNVEVGAEAEGQVRVLAGLTRGDRVVTDGALFLNNEIETR
jgi:cobalt-zinc-cadmium efflux system membrane fusion protein